MQRSHTDTVSTESVILACSNEPNPKVIQELAASGRSVHLMHSIPQIVTFLDTTESRVVIVTELRLDDGSWRDLVDHVRIRGHAVPFVLLAPRSTPELWWDALECCVNEVVAIPDSSQLAGLFKTL